MLEAVQARVGAIVAIVAIVAVLAVGTYFAGKLPRDSRARVEQIAAGPSEASTMVDVAGPSSAAGHDPAAFARDAKADARRFGLPDFDPEILAAPQRHRVLIEDAVTLAAGQSWTSADLRVAVTEEKVQYQKLGATVAARHSIAVITNVSDRPLAYAARLRSDDRGLCEVRAARMHNAMALMPDEVADVVVCAGGGKVRVERLEVLELSPLGYHYVSQLPPGALGLDPITAASHEPMSRVALCTSVDDTGLSAQIRQGLVRWVDVVDFYSRHSCERFQYVEGYRHGDAERPLPAAPPG